MDLNEYLSKLSSINLEKKTRIVLLIVYALIMFVAIQSQMNIITFILLFAVVPIGVYIYVKKIFPKEN